MGTSAERDALPPIGTYWTEGALTTSRAMVQEAYLTCARCGAFVNVSDRHDDWHHAVEHILPPDVSNPAPAPLTTNETRED